MLDLGALTGGGSTRSAEVVEVEIKDLSPAVDIILPTRTPIIGGSKG